MQIAGAGQRANGGHMWSMPWDAVAALSCCTYDS